MEWVPDEGDHTSVIYVEMINFVEYNYDLHRMA